MLLNRTRAILLTVWGLTIFVWLPPIWKAIFGADYFISGMQGSQRFLYSAPYLLIILAWSAVLSWPKFRTKKILTGAASTFVTIGLLLNSYAIFKQTPGHIIMLAGFALAYSLKDGSSDEAGDIAAEIVAEPETAEAFASKDGLHIAWMLVVILAAPWLWLSLSGEAFFIRNARGMQDFAVAGPVMLIMLFWAIYLSFPSRRTVNANCAAAASSLCISLFLFWYFEHSGWTGTWFAALWWMRNAYSTAKTETPDLSTAS